MDMNAAVDALSALGHEKRLAAFRMLVRAGPDGVPAGEIARELGAVPNTLSAHLSILYYAGLVRSRREGRSVIYVADYQRMAELLSFLVEECCNGDPAICGTLGELTKPCP